MDDDEEATTIGESGRLGTAATVAVAVAMAGVGVGAARVITTGVILGWIFGVDGTGLGLPEPPGSSASLLLEVPFSVTSCLFRFPRANMRSRARRFLSASPADRGELFTPACEGFLGENAVGMGTLIRGVEGKVQPFELAVSVGAPGIAIVRGPGAELDNAVEDMGTVGEGFLAGAELEDGVDDVKSAANEVLDDDF